MSDKCKHDLPWDDCENVDCCLEILGNEQEWRTEIVRDEIEALKKQNARMLNTLMWIGNESHSCGDYEACVSEAKAVVEDTKSTGKIYRFFGKKYNKIEGEWVCFENEATDGFYLEHRDDFKAAVNTVIWFMEGRKPDLFGLAVEINEPGSVIVIGK